MPKNNRKSRSAIDTALNADAFLRSINLQYDAQAPERIAHFRPTAKSVRMLQALVGQTDERAFFIVAPYGTGKSLAATYLLHLIENRPDSKHALRQIATRFDSVSPEFAELAQRRLRSKTKRGLVAALHGVVESVPAALKAACLDSMSRMKLGRQARSLSTLPAKNLNGHCP